MKAKRSGQLLSPAYYRSLSQLLLLLSIVSFSFPGTPAAAEQDSAIVYTNRLIDSNDPYLLLHAHNPVDWYPWGAAALEKARREHKLIFLSVGYATCYWCHVAERQIYSNPAIAQLMNRWFVNIKVDREQRPDIDAVYMLATQIMTGGGGWPNNVFLTPDLKPIFAGSYFPAVETQGRKSFPQILTAIHRAWLTDETKLTAAAEQVYERLQRAESGVPGTPVEEQTLQQWRKQALIRARGVFDEEEGGFGHGPTKFPQAPLLSLLLDSYSSTQDDETRHLLRATLLAMAEGGVMDQLAGGFHRYSTDPHWSVPHFEKMLADNAQLLGIFARASRLLHEPYFRWVAETSAQYLLTRMQAPQGGFFNAKDAEVKGVEGASYVWHRRAIESLLGEEDAVRFFSLYRLVPVADPLTRQQPPGPIKRPEPPAVLRLDRQAAQPLLLTHGLSGRLDRLENQRQQLLTARDQRQQPARDEKIVTADNALTIIGIAEAATALNSSALIHTATQTGEWLWQNAFHPSCECLSHQIFHGHSDRQAFLDDYALLGRAYMILHRMSGEVRWQQRAVRLADAMLARFSRPDGKLAASWDHIDLVIAPPAAGDSVRPGGDSAAIGLLLELSAVTAVQKYALAAQRDLVMIGRQVALQPMSWGALLNLAGRPPLLAALQRAARRAGKMNPPDSADYVHARATALASGANCDLTVTLKVDPGFHINANPASESDLVATELLLAGKPVAQAEYPKADAFSPAFTSQSIAVYQGRTHVLAHLARNSAVCSTAQTPVSLRVQACNAKVCLAPATLRVPIARSSVRERLP